ncbi:hypothetical protein GCM10011415_34630 [Salipiger pallidus]|uniref:Uncharacterized protein n=1 Tax=Salipiger pallidus TaxID=1775170 RepID=A0A8J3EI07_9RHOB|nr:hypothetical protein [Salipiger pallidus]GGG82047.1 hypothetical protein GCM10011415_34630 [Salipiger pallidus]
MEWLVWVGAGVSIVGLLGLMGCIFKVWSSRRKGMTDDQLREVVRKVVPLNMGALLFSVLGLMMVILGIFLA